MDIGIVTTQFATIGGVENVVRQLGKHLSKRHNVSLITRKRKQNTSDFATFFTDVYQIEGATNYLSYLRNGRRFFNQHDNEFDLLHFHNWSTILPAQGIDTPKLLTFHGTSHTANYQRNNYIRSALYWGVETLAAHLADHITSLTEYHLQHLTTNKPTTIIPNGIEPTKHRKKGHSIKEKPQILYVGSLTSNKGVSTLIDSLTHEKREVKLTLCGDGPDRKRFEQQANKLPDHVEVSFEGTVPHDEIPYYYRNADIFVLPTLHEGFPLVLLEAMNYGVPLITTKVEGIPEIIKDNHNGLLVRPNDSEGLANAIKKLIRNQELRERLASNGFKKIAQEYNIENVVEQYETVYQEMVE